MLAKLTGQYISAIRLSCQKTTAKSLVIAVLKCTVVVVARGRLVSPSKWNCNYLRSTGTLELGAYSKIQSE